MRVAFIVGCVVAIISAVRFKGPEVRIWDSEQCGDLGSNILSSPIECMKRCKNTVGCTALNYNSDDSICVLRACSLPVHKPAKNESSFVGYSIVTDSAMMCSDRHRSCAKRVAEGECETNISYMSDHCMASCIMFSTPERTCKDKNTNCGIWAARGECEGSPYYMNFNCPESCDLCACPKEFFGVSGTNNCYKVFDNTERNWEEALKKCETEELNMASLIDTVAINLRKKILERHGHSTSVWLQARGDGSNLVWQTNNKKVRKDSPLWQPDEPTSYITTEDCLYMDVGDSSWRQYPDRPYASYHCSSRENLYTLCEKPLFMFLFGANILTDHMLPTIVK